MMNTNPQGHWLGHLLARKHREHRPTHPKHGLQIWHNTPGQYIECTCKLTTTMQQGKTITPVSHDRGLGYSNRLCDSAEFVHVTHTMELFLRPTPRNLSHGILGTRPRRSELESPTRSSYRVSLLPHHRRRVLGSLVSPRHLCLLDTGPPWS